ncbi:unnamed protein product, partial [Urochloa humidicola]
GASTPSQTSLPSFLRSTSRGHRRRHLRAVYPSGGSRGEGQFCHLLRNPLFFSFPVDSFTAVTVEATTLFAEEERARVGCGVHADEDRVVGEGAAREFDGAEATEEQRILTQCACNKQETSSSCGVQCILSYLQPLIKCRA